LLAAARGDVRWVAAVFVGADETENVVPPSPPADRRANIENTARDPLFDCSLRLAAMFAGLPPS